MSTEKTIPVFKKETKADCQVKPYRHAVSKMTVTYEQDGHAFTATGVYCGPVTERQEDISQPKQAPKKAKKESE